MTGWSNQECQGLKRFIAEDGEFAPDIGKRFIDSAGLVVVKETGGVFRNAVRQFMAHHIVRTGKALPINHLGAVPEGVRKRTGKSCCTIPDG